MYIKTTTFHLHNNINYDYAISEGIQNKADFSLSYEMSVFINVSAQHCLETDFV